MYNKKYTLLICTIFLFIITINFACSQPPFQQSEKNVGFLIETGYTSTHSLNNDYYLHTHVYNASNGLLIDSNINCYYHFYDHQKNGDEHIAIGEMDNYGAGYNASIDGELINNTGEYSALIWCNNSEEGGFFQYTFLVTESGIEITEGRSIFAIGSVAILCILLFISLYSLFSIDSYIGKFIFYWISHLFIVLIFFICWQMGVEGLLGGIGVTGIFRILFYISVVAVFPMVILSLAWIFYIHVYNEHFQNLVEKGMDTERAFQLTNRKFKGGWFYGRSR